MPVLPRKIGTEYSPNTSWSCLSLALVITARTATPRCRTASVPCLGFHYRLCYLALGRLVTSGENMHVAYKQ